MGLVGGRAACSADVWRAVGVFVLNESEFPGDVLVVLVVSAAVVNGSMSPSEVGAERVRVLPSPVAQNIGWDDR